MRIYQFIYNGKINGKRHGYKIKYKNDKIKSRIHWLNNKRHGSKIIYSSGKIDYICNFANGKNIGDKTEYYKTGNILYQSFGIHYRLIFLFRQFRLSHNQVAFRVVPYRLVRCLFLPNFRRVVRTCRIDNSSLTYINSCVFRRHLFWPVIVWYKSNRQNP